MLVKDMRHYALYHHLLNKFIFRFSAIKTQSDLKYRPIFFLNFVQLDTRSDNRKSNPFMCFISLFNYSELLLANSSRRCSDYYSCNNV